ncbi:ABC transporter permease [Nocardiopsis metallicus]|uniref:ABC-2 type transport system permease protein n=1 Tax=Nocardiopsis metallicus TaxID=179819 RepID=A0A840WC34_9ACTN|nr:ABC transporter permease [Nocardiopsis metallicus]MBB5493704.1 ABC-2 type transport system permease protein [Nocardiopsis metallicus]
MSAIRDSARVLRWSATSALADLRAFYTWKTWLFGWLTRILCQVAFFALIGAMLDSPDRTAYLLVGNAVFVGVTATMFVCASSSWERMAGTLPLLIASPAPPFLVFAGRSVQWLADGLACAVISLFLLAPVFGVHLPMPAALLVVPLIALTYVSVYSFGLVLAGLALRVMHVRNLIGNVGGLILMVVCGVQVPVSFWPPAVEFVAQGLPLTHGLGAVRELLSGASGAVVARLALLEAAVGAVWFCVAALTFRHLAESGRRDGSIEFGD